MYKNEEAKKAYFKDRYQNFKEDYKKANENYWVRYARKRLGKPDVTEDEVRECRNTYYREYRAAHPKETKEIQERFYENWNERNELRKEN